MKLLKEHKTFEGQTSFWSHNSKITNSEMKFSTFIPQGKKIEGCLIWLSGLTCNEENFITKSGVQNHLKNSNLMVICPDTSPRGLNLKSEHENYDFGSGAGFYLNATSEGYRDHYLMFDYISSELHQIIIDEFLAGSNSPKISISGHSMGGHGALILGLNFPEKYQSISAFSPITNPINCAWGQKAFKGYLGEENKDSWKKYDACELVKSAKIHPGKILIDQGLADEFLENQLLTQNFINVCDDSKQKLEVNFRDGYDHSYYFISSFIESHLRFHEDGMKS